MGASWEVSWVSLVSPNGVNINKDLHSDWTLVWALPLEHCLKESAPQNWSRERTKCFTGYISNDFRLCTLGSDLALLLAPFWSYFCTTDRSQVANNAA